MTGVPGSARDRIQITPPSELGRAPTLVVRIGKAPDGLPWLLGVDRSHRLRMLFDTVLHVFDLERIDQLPSGVRSALENDVASGLMGVHSAQIAGRAKEVYVSKHKLKHLLGPTLLSQTLEGSPERAPGPFLDSGAATNVAAAAAGELDEARLEAVERSIEERNAKRHLLVALDDGAVYSGAVAKPDRALRAPSPPFRPLAFESLARLDARAVFHATGREAWQVPLGDAQAYEAALLRAHQSGERARVEFEISKARVASELALFAGELGAIHARGRVHADIAPGNILLTDEGPISYDGLDVEAGSPAVAATFDWAAPEQIVGLPIDPRTDVYSLGRMLCAIVGGVPFGTESQYVVPIGGRKSRRVTILKTEGVFVDVLETKFDRTWQRAWQDFLGRCLAHDAARRPKNARELSDELKSLLETHRLDGTLTCPGAFGTPVPFEIGTTSTFARHVVD